MAKNGFMSEPSDCMEGSRDILQILCHNRRLELLIGEMKEKNENEENVFHFLTFVFDILAFDKNK